MIRFTQSDKKPELERMGKGKLIRIFFFKDMIWSF